MVCRTTTTAKGYVSVLLKMTRRSWFFVYRSDNTIEIQPRIVVTETVECDNIQNKTSVALSEKCCMNWNNFIDFLIIRRETAVMEQVWFILIKHFMNWYILWITNTQLKHIFGLMNFLWCKYIYSGKSYCIILWNWFGERCGLEY